MTNWYQSSDRSAMADRNLLTTLEEAQRKTEFRVSGMADAIGGINRQLDEWQAQFDEFNESQKEHKVQLARLDKWHQEMVSHQKSSYLQLKSMSAMASDIHRKICKLSEGGLRPEETRLGFNPNMKIQDRGAPIEEVSREIENSLPQQPNPQRCQGSVIPGVSLEESNQDSLEEAIRGIRDLKGIAWIKEFGRLKKLGMADKVLSYLIDNDRTEEVVEEPVSSTDSEQESINQSNSMETIEDQEKIEDTHQVFDGMPARKLVKNSDMEAALCASNIHKEVVNSSISDQENGEQSSHWYACFRRGIEFFSKQEFGLMDRLCFIENMSSAVAYNGMGASFDPTGIGWNSFKTISVSSLEIIGAHYMFDELPIESFKGSDFSVLPINAPLFMGNWVFNPRGFIDFRLVEKAGFELREVSVASDNQKDSKQICQTLNWEIEDNVDKWVMQGSVMQIPVVGNVLNWIGCIGIFNCIRVVGKSHSMPFDRGKSQIFQSCPLCNKFIGEMQSSLVFVGAWIEDFGLPEMDCKLLVVVECVWMKQVTSSYERNYVQQIAQGSDVSGMLVEILLGLLLW